MLLEMLEYAGINRIIRGGTGMQLAIGIAAEKLVRQPHLLA